MNKNPFIFFLGGHDAEMEEIKNILSIQNYPFHDRKLRWGALLSEYNEELKQLKDHEIPVFVELTLDTAYPQRSVIIDHHGERSGKEKKTSVEQIAELLNIELNRHQKLISINDKSHIKGMTNFGANETEINHIRKLDRLAQGVTEQDEKLAQKTVDEKIEKIGNNAAIVVSLAERTSAVVDRIHDRFKHLVVYTPDGNIHYFGPGAMVYKLISIYRTMKEQDASIEFWYGGGLPDYGYLGSKKALDKNYVVSLLLSAD